MAHLTALARLAAAMLLAATLAGSVAAATRPTKVYLPLAPGRPPQQLQQLVPASRVTGSVGVAAAAGNIVYLASGVGLDILDTSAGPPRLVGNLALPVLPTEIGAIVPAGPLLYIVANLNPGQQPNATLLTLNIAEPLQPRIVSTTTVPNPGGVLRNAVVGADRLSINTSEGLLVFDLGDPRAPHLAATTREQSITSLAAYNRYLYRAGLPILDLTNPASPRVVGQSLPDPVFINNFGSIAVVGDVLYILTAELRIIGGERCSDNRLQAYSLRDPTAPMAVGFARFPATAPNTPGGRCYSFGLAAAGPGRIVLGFPGLMQLVDTSDPLNPQPGQLLQQDQDSSNIIDDIVSGTTALFPRGETLLAYDVTDPSRVEPLPSYNPPLPSVIRRVYKADAAHVVVAGDNSFTLVNVANRVAPGVIGAEQQRDDNFTVVDVAVVGDRLYTLEYGYSTSPTRLRVSTGVTAGELRLAGIVSMEYQGIDLVAKGDFAYVSTYGGGLGVVDVSVATEPRVVRTVPVRSATMLELDGELLRTRITATDTTVADIALSLADPANPVEVARTPADGRWIDLPGDRPIVYSEGYGAGDCARCTLKRLEIAERRAEEPPLPRGSLDLASTGWPELTRYSVGSSFIVYSTSEGILQLEPRKFSALAVLDVRDPDNPAFYALDGPGSRAQDHALLGRTIVAGYGASGLALYLVPPELP